MTFPFFFYTHSKDTNRQDNSGKTPLFTAILSKQFRIVDELLKNDADVAITDDAGDTPLHAAVHVGSEKLVLVSKRFDVRVHRSHVGNLL